MSLLKSEIGRLRIVAFLEGISFVLLVGVASPIKRIYDMPEVIQIPGMIHGLLFVIYCYLVWMAKEKNNWDTKTFGLLLLASVLPFGTFVADKKILSKIETTASDS